MSSGVLFCAAVRSSCFVRHLDRMIVYPGGESAVQELAAYWYAYHKNRPTMKDELHKAGYPQKQEKLDLTSDAGSSFLRL